ncbi:MAG: hypothetical protein AAF585_23765, partial [Verrucomicrobiota bacterium]
PPDLRASILSEAEVVEEQGWFLSLFWAVPLPIKAGVAAIWIVAIFLQLTTPELETIGAMNFDERPPQINEADSEVMLAFNRDHVEAFLDSESEDLF